MKKINLKCRDVKLWGDSQTKRRHRQTLKRVWDATTPSLKVLDVGGESVFGREMADHLGLWYHYTTDDLNWFNNYDFYDYVFCFEVIEHLMNPLLFLSNIKAGRMFVTYPYSPILQGKRHFNEMTPDQFYTLVDEAGWKIVLHDSFRNFNTLKVYCSGFRPLVKFVLQVLGLSKIHFYILERK